MGRLIYVWYCNFEGNRRHCYGAALSQEYLVTTDIVKNAHPVSVRVKINKNKEYACQKDFYGKNIDCVTAVVGENGSGGTAQTGENAGNGEDLQVEGTEAMRQDETETPDVSGTGKAEADVKGTQTPEFPYYICINRKQNCVTIYTQDEEGEYTVPYKAMVCSTGLYNATPRGTYQISTKYLWRELYGGVYGQYATRIHGGILFHSVPYYKRAKDTLCTDKYNKLGQQASMGCVRLTVEDAKWIAENCAEGTTVEIYDGDDPGPLGKPEAQKLDKSDPDCHWDPTDPDEENPWQQTETSVTESEQEK